MAHGTYDAERIHPGSLDAAADSVITSTQQAPRCAFISYWKQTKGASPFLLQPEMV